jgi:hypothetical protein
MMEHWCEKSTADVTSFMPDHEVRSRGLSVHSACEVIHVGQTRIGRVVHSGNDVIRILKHVV